jgi:DNA-binding NtrC family response regulator
MHRTAASTQHRLRKWANAKPAILVIEDEPFVREVTCEILRDAGYHVFRAESAAAARAMFLQGGGKIQLLLCDAVLPDGSGIALSQMLRRQSPGLKVILASGYPGAASCEALEIECSAAFLAKPYGAAALIAKVQMALQSVA